MKRIASLLSILLLASCASMLNPGPDLIAVNSSPPGADVFLDGAATGLKTPCQINVQRSAEGIVLVKLDGFADASAKITTAVNGPVILNIFWGYAGVFFIFIDIVSGNASEWISIPTFSLAKREK